MSDIEIKLGGEVFVLKPTLRAAKKISETFGGFGAALMRLGNADLAAVAIIIAAGSGRNSSSQREHIEELAYEAGMEAVLVPSVKFVELLTRGGRETEASTEGAEGNE